MLSNADRHLLLLPDGVSVNLEDARKKNLLAELLRVAGHRQHFRPLNRESVVEVDRVQVALLVLRHFVKEVLVVSLVKDEQSRLRAIKELLHCSKEV